MNSMKKIALSLLVASTVVTNSGCSILFGDTGYFRSRAMDYKTANDRAPLQLPEGTNSGSRVELYPVPAAGANIKDVYTPKDGDDIPHPQGLLSVNEEAGVEVREKDDKRWLVVRKAPATVFASTRNFVENNGFKVEKADAASGTIETGWLKPREDEQPGFFKRLFTLNFRDNYDKFRFQVEDDGGASRVLIDQVREEATGTSSLPESVDWQGATASASLTKIIANDLSDFIAEEQANSYRTGVLASAYANAPRTIMTWDGNGFPVLVVTMDMNRAWAAVGTALEKSQLKVRDMNRSLEVYYLKRGKHASDSESDDSDQEGKDSNQYQLKLLRADEGVHIAVQLDDNTLAPAGEAQKLLETIKEYIE